MQTLRVVAARQHNLKGITCELPRDRLVVVTGPSGSGKSSLAFDTIYAEGQRRYVESLSPRARQWLEQLPRPRVDLVDGLSPSIAIEQRGLGTSPRSTVGTVTEIADYLRVLFSSIGVAHCPRSGRVLVSYTAEGIADRLASLPEAERFVILAPVARELRGSLEPELAMLRRHGYARARIDGAYVDLESDLRFAERKAHSIEVVVDRLIAGKATRQRLVDSVEHALSRGGGTLLVDHQNGEAPEALSERLVSWEYGIELPPLEPKLFSFNSPAGACPSCKGLGVVADEDEAGPRFWALRGRSSQPPCPTCHGTRLRAETELVTVAGHRHSELVGLSLSDLAELLAGLIPRLTEAERAIATPLLEDVGTRLRFLCELGLHHLSLDRATTSLSAGEQRRIRLATQLASHLVGVLYVLDEPSVGLHPRDTETLGGALRRLVERGNTVILVEHDLSLIRSADYVLELGPGAGEHGGRLVASGSVEALMSDPDSLTGAYLAGRRPFAPAHRQFAPTGWLEVLDARAHNLKGVNARFPLGGVTAVTGVSGSGKTSLVVDTLWRAAERFLAKGADGAPPSWGEISGLDAVGKVIGIDQSSIGRTPRSNPATYSGIFGELRELFATLPEARARGYKAGRFSFNAKGGRCEVCRGDGVVEVEMHFLPDIFVPCEACRGRRYNRETLEVRYRGKNIAEALELTVDDASELFDAVPEIARVLGPLRRLGLGYLKLGQPAPTLSGGEAQRLKLATELARPAADHTLYVLDEPTSGLHLAEVELLIDALFALCDAGHTVVVIEHLSEFIACADWVVDLGPEGGSGGGQLVVMGTPAEVAACEASHTGRALAGLQHPPSGR